MRLLAAFCAGKNLGPHSVMGAKASKLLIPPGGLPRYPSRHRPHTSSTGTPLHVFGNHYMSAIYAQYAKKSSRGSFLAFTAYPLFTQITLKNGKCPGQERGTAPLAGPVPGMGHARGLLCAVLCACKPVPCVFPYACHDRTSRGQILAVWVASTGYARLTTWQPLERFGPSHGKSQPGGLAACAASRAVSRPVPHDMGAHASLAVVLPVPGPSAAQTGQRLPCPGFRVSARWPPGHCPGTERPGQ